MCPGFSMCGVVCLYRCVHVLGAYKTQSHSSITVVHSNASVYSQQIDSLLACIDWKLVMSVAATALRPRRAWPRCAVNHFALAPRATMQRATGTRSGCLRRSRCVASLSRYCVVAFSLCTRGQASVISVDVNVSSHSLLCVSTCFAPCWCAL